MRTISTDSAASGNVCKKGVMMKDQDKEKGGKKRLKLGEYLILSGLINQQTLEYALELQKTQNKKIGEILVDLGIVDDTVIAKALSQQFKIPYMRLRNISISDETLDLIPASMAKENRIVPIFVKNRRLTIAMSNPLDTGAVEGLKSVVQMTVDIVVAPKSDVLEIIEKYYPKK
ncbi:MAG: hypothetical protein AB1659_00110 [Thermodesulfobacteriota bacterium]